MALPKGRRRAVPPAAKSIPLSSKLKPHINNLLKGRYIDEEPVDLMLRWLEEQDCKISSRSYYEFMARVLTRLPLTQAQAMGVNVILLRAIRVRLKLPTDPKGKRVRAKRTISRYDSRHERRPLTLAANPKNPKPTIPRPQPEVRVPKDRSTSSGIDQPIPSGIVPEPTPAEIREFERITRFELKDVNKEAVRKIRAINRNIITNNRGTCMDIMTRESFEMEDLQRLFGLTYAEARSCFLTVDD